MRKTIELVGPKGIFTGILQVNLNSTENYVTDYLKHKVIGIIDGDVILRHLVSNDNLINVLARCETEIRDKLQIRMDSIVETEQVK